MRRLVLSLACLALLVVGVRGQSRDATTANLMQMVDTERAFAARALVVGWKQAFLEYFADEAVGFDEGKVALAKEQFRAAPDPPKELQLRWEPRYGDISATGEIGYLIGPVRNILPSRNNGQPRHSNYASIWKRQNDGRYRVVLDFGVPTPGPVSYAPGFTQAPHASRFAGDYDENTPPLGAADSVLNSGLRTQPGRAYRDYLAAEGRLLRPNQLPVVGVRAVTASTVAQRRFAAADTRFTESARSGDLGYTWGTYEMVGGARGASKEHGFYVRVWVRERNRQWKLALDALHPQ